MLPAGDGASAENRPQFRGPTVQGPSAEKNPPLKLSATENVAWKTELPGEEPHSAELNVRVCEFVDASRESARTRRRIILHPQP